MKMPVILLAFANDRENENRFLNELDKEQQELGDLLVRQFNIQLLPQATLPRMERMLHIWGNDIRIFHFAGHANAQKIELAHAQSEYKYGYVEGVAKTIGLQSGIELVFLNGCSTAAQVNYFIKAGIPAVIFTQAPVNDTVARTFSKLFYQNFIDNPPKTLNQAFNAAQAQLESRYENFQSMYTRNIGIGEEQYLSTNPYSLSLKTSRAGELTYQELTIQNELIPYTDIPPPHAYLLCNRDIPNDDFCEILQKSKKEIRRKPLFVLIHGKEEELPSYMCLRFTHFSIPDSFKKLGEHYLQSRLKRIEVATPGAKDLKNPIKAILTIKESLKDELQLENSFSSNILDLNGKDIVENLGPHLKVAFFQHNLYDIDWSTKNQNTFLTEYLGNFWNIDLPESSPDIIVAFNLQYSPPKGLFKKFSKSNNIIIGGFRDHWVHILERLISIPRIDVKKWNDKYAPDDPDLTDRIYPRNRPQPMQRIIKPLREAITRRRQIN